MKLANSRPWIAVGLLGLSGLGAVVALARPDPDPRPPAGWVQPAPAQLPGEVARAPEAPYDRAAPPIDNPLRPTDRRDWLSPQADLLILFALGGWLWMMMSRRRREQILLDANYDGRRPVERGQLRTVTYPSESHSRELRRYRERWIEEFRSLQNAWARHDLRPVSGIIDPEVRDELEQSAGFANAARDPGLPQIVIDQADPADSWQESGKEHVTVHFAGRILEPGAARAELFDEYWTFFRKLAEGETDAAAESSAWVVASIRRGNRERSLPRLAQGR